VPLVVRFPDGVAHVRSDERGRVARAAWHLDLWPTMLEALGLDPGRCRGLSLLRPELPESRYFLQALGRGERNRWMALGDGRWRLVARSGDRPRLYDVASDPRETHDLAAEHPEIVRALLRLHEEDRVAFPPDALAEQRIEKDAETERGLGALGYAEDDEN
jgi:arylsulfatase